MVLKPMSILKPTFQNAVGVSGKTVFKGASFTIEGFCIPIKWGAAL